MFSPYSILTSTKSGTETSATTEGERKEGGNKIVPFKLWKTKSECTGEQESGSTFSIKIVLREFSNLNKRSEQNLLLVLATGLNIAVGIFQKRIGHRNPSNLLILVTSTTFCFNSWSWSVS